MADEDHEDADLAPEGEADEQQEDNEDSEDDEVQRLRAELETTKKRLADREKAERDSKAADRRRKREKAIKDGKHEEVLAAERELREEAESERDDLKAQVERYKSDQRRSVYAEKIAKAAGGGNARAIARLLSTFDLELSDTPSKAEIKVAHDKVKDEAPELLGATHTQPTNGRPPNRPGIPPNSNGITAAPGTPEFYRQLAEHNSGQRRVPESYAKATGRGGN